MSDVAKMIKKYTVGIEGGAQEELNLSNGALNIVIGQIANGGLIKTATGDGRPLDIAVATLLGCDDQLSAMNGQPNFEELSVLKPGDIIAFTHGGVDVKPAERAPSGEVTSRERRQFRNVIFLWSLAQDGQLEKPEFLKGRAANVLIDKRAGDQTGKKEGEIGSTGKEAF